MKARAGSMTIDLWWCGEVNKTEKKEKEKEKEQTFPA
jgi:hypothetical protein